MIFSSKNPIFNKIKPTVSNYSHFLYKNGYSKALLSYRITRIKQKRKSILQKSSRQKIQKSFDR